MKTRPWAVAPGLASLVLLCGVGLALAGERSGRAGDGRVGAAVWTRDCAPSLPPEDDRASSVSKRQQAGKRKAARPGLALALSGGGYRAAAFHLGALIRLNEAGLLKRVDQVSSVSGGSIVAGTLGLHWSNLNFDRNGVAANLDAVIGPVRRLLSTPIDVGAVLVGFVGPGRAGEEVAKVYDRMLFQGKTLQDLPGKGEGPFFLINATNVRTGTLWRFTRSYMGDYRIGYIDHPNTPLSTAVAASSAFPPFLSPMLLPIPSDARFRRYAEEIKLANDRERLIVDCAFFGPQLLTDGGVYDNLGLEPVDDFEALLVSDGGQRIKDQSAPPENWAAQIRTLEIIDNQVRSLRKRRLIDDYLNEERAGASWAIDGKTKAYHPPTDPLNAAACASKELSETPTRLDAMPEERQELLINWGYAVSDASLRSFFSGYAKKRYGVTIAEPKGFPFPSRGCRIGHDP